MTRLLFDAGKTVFHFLLPSNSRYLILAGNAKLWGCYPNCSSEFSASGEQSKYEKQSVRNYFLLVVMGSALVFSKVGSWGFCSPRSVNVTHIHSWVWGESRMRRTFTLSVDWGVPQSGEKCKHASGSPSHMFILPHTHKQLVCMRSHSHIRSPKDKTEKCQLLNIGKAQQPQEWQTVEERLAQALSHAFSQKSKHAAFIPQQSYLLLNNSALSLCDKLEVSCIVYEYLRGWGYSDCEDYPSTLRNVSRPFLKMPFMLKAR